MCPISIFRLFAIVVLGLTASASYAGPIEILKVEAFPYGDTTGCRIVTNEGNGGAFSVGQLKADVFQGNLEFVRAMAAREPSPQNVTSVAVHELYLAQVDMIRAACLRSSASGSSVSFDSQSNVLAQPSLAAKAATISTRTDITESAAANLGIANVTTSAPSAKGCVDLSSHYDTRNFGGSTTNFSVPNSYFLATNSCGITISATYCTTGAYRYGDTTPLQPKNPCSNRASWGGFTIPAHGKAWFAVIQEPKENSLRPFLYLCPSAFRKSDLTWDGSKINGRCSNPSEN